MKLSGLSPSAGPTMAGIISKSMKAQAQVRADAEAEARPKGQSKLRSDFKSALDQRLKGAFSNVPQAMKPYLDEAGKFDSDRLPEEAVKELVKLQTAAEGFESYFVKDLLSKMRPPSMTDEPSPMTTFAKDLMDQTMADTTAKGRSSIGIGKTVFLSMGEQVAKRGLGTAMITAQKEGK